MNGVPRREGVEQFSEDVRTVDSCGNGGYVLRR
jgi:hypothetical protein